MTSAEVSGETVPRPRAELPGGFTALLRCLLFVGYGLVELLSLAWLAVVLTLSCIGIGLPLLPGALALIRGNAQRQRRAAWTLSGIPVDVTNLPFPDRGRVFGVGAAGRRLTDPTVLKDLAWHVLNPVVGVVSIVAGPLLARAMLRLHGLWVRWVLRTDRTEQLRARIARLQETRSTALDLQQVEIQRIERDLHDGPQARLVAMGMTLTQVARLLETDPERAAALLGNAKADSAAALQELRDLVRGIRPPVLADRGLTEALRALAASAAVDTVVESDLSQRLSPPLESALDFAVAELVTNATKHAGARRIRVTLTGAGAVVRAVVTDDGGGGADAGPDPAGGLAGIRRRLQPFDGELVLVSPQGGPTTATITVPDVRA